MSTGSLRTSCVHRAGRRDAVECAAQRADGGREHIEIMRAFVELRRVAGAYSEIQGKLDALERRTAAKLGEHDEKLAQIFEALRQLIAPPSQPERRVGFQLPEDADT